MAFGMSSIMRFAFLFLIGALFAFTPGTRAAENDLAEVKAEVTKEHDQNIKRLQDWIAQVSISEPSVRPGSGACPSKSTAARLQYATSAGGVAT